ncbi:MULTISPECIES: MFS transporter [Kitasatospora]|uniref:Putative major facilitator superfamily transporter n=1 Tax=Kitasatospora setae (strain ATCC 33774 / DSM 43861 / JCM 3304 / KCC A-0304 / NBRC 14216 / KM-6054) TaxID=452652 RepID=E4N217_KITSK|nr:MULTISPECIES: MFS transporter [Kitasatospora]BAJ32201.1 putative major facilitator superfamily transporter [Kitasatospora setae KM-6054]
MNAVTTSPPLSPSSPPLSPPPSRSPVVRRLAALLLVNAVGNGLFLTVGALWFTRGLGFSAGVVGAALTAAGLCGVPAALPVGRLCDRWGAKPVLVVVHVVQAAATAVFACAGSLWLFVVLVCVTGTASRANGVARSTLYAHALPAGSRTRALAVLRALNNVGIGAGAALGALVTAHGGRVGLRAAVCASAAAYLLALLPLRAVPTGAAPAGGAAGPGAARPLRDVPFLGVAALNAVVNTLYVVLEVGLPLWTLGHTAAGPAVTGWLLLANTALVALAQVAAARRVAGLAGAARSFRRGGLLVGAACLALAGAAGRTPGVAVAVLVGAVVLLTAGEVLSQAGSWALSYGLAPEHAHGAYQGVLHTGVALGQALAPAALTVLVLPHGTAGWASLAAVFAAAALALPPVARRAAVGRGERPLLALSPQ